MTVVIYICHVYFAAMMGTVTDQCDCLSAAISKTTFSVAVAWFFYVGIVLVVLWMTSSLIELYIITL